MANSRYKFFETVWNGEIQHEQKGFPKLSVYNLFGGLEFISFKIPLTHAYRPDLIAKDFYGDPMLYWVIVYANAFSNSPQDFAPNIIIKVPKFNQVMSSI